MELRKTHIDAIGDVPWGTHVCQLYRGAQDLLEVLVPYIKGGLEDHEFCMWITSAPLGAQEAKAALRAAGPDLDDRLAAGQIEVLDYTQWYTLGGRFDGDKVLKGVIEKLQSALQRGYEGLRLTGNTHWLEPAGWKDFRDYEAAVDSALSSCRMLALCTYSLDRCGAAEVADVVVNHEMALIRRAGAWQVIRRSGRSDLQEEFRRQELEERVRHRTAELTAAVDQLQGKISQRIAAERDLETERRRLTAVLNRFPGYVVLKDRNHRVRFANHGYMDAFSDPQGRPCHQVQYGREAPCEECPAPGVIEGGQPADWEWTASDGRTLHVWAFPFTDVDGEAAMLQIGIDVTDRKSLERLIVGTAEAERRRIGRDLDDAIGQELTALVYLAEGLSDRLEGTSPQDGDVARRIAETVRKAVSQVRSLAEGLDPVGLEKEGLADALRGLAREADAAGGIACQFHSDGQVRLDEATATEVYRIAQEAVSNATRHAKARTIDIRLGCEDGAVVLSVEDDGRGFRADRRQPEGMGLRVMKYRAEGIGGRLTIRSGPGGGTVVVCRFPLRAARSPMAEGKGELP